MTELNNIVIIIGMTWWEIHYFLCGYLIEELLIEINVNLFLKFGTVKLYSLLEKVNISEKGISFPSKYDMHLKIIWIVFFVSLEVCELQWLQSPLQSG